MTQEDLFRRLAQEPAYAELKQSQRTISTTFTGICLFMTAAFILMVVFAPETLRQPISEGSYWSKGLILGFTLMVISWLLTGLYILIANTRLDARRTALIEKVKA